MMCWEHLLCRGPMKVGRGWRSSTVTYLVCDLSDSKVVMMKKEECQIVEKLQVLWAGKFERVITSE